MPAGFGTQFRTHWHDFNSFQSSVAFHVKTSHLIFLIFNENQEKMAGLGEITNFYDVSSFIFSTCRW